eukprot:scaffold53784_cov17-Tisochrysis_lutea.AAC.1
MAVALPKMLLLLCAEVMCMGLKQAHSVLLSKGAALPPEVPVGLKQAHGVLLFKGAVLPPE